MSNKSTDSLQFWDSAFVAYLRDSNYHNTELKENNIKNIYNMLFVYECRNKGLGEPPQIDELVSFMIENGSLSRENEVYKLR